MITIACGNLRFENLEAIIFDKDGTLEDSHAYLRELAIKRSRLIDAQIPGIGEPLLMAFGLQEQLDPTGLMAVGSRQENEIAAAAYIAETGRSWFESLTIARHCFQEADRYCPADVGTSPIFTGAVECIQTLWQSGLKLAILSAARTESIERFVAEHGLKDYFSVLMGADQGLSKPDPHFFWQACDRLNIKPENTLMIGDSQGDITMAKQAQAKGSIAIAHYPLPTIVVKEADVVIQHFNQIKILD